MRLINTLFLLCSYYLVYAQSPSPFIHVDQFGYRVDDRKVAVLSDPQIGYNQSESYSPSSLLEIKDASTHTTMLSIAPQLWNGGNTHVQSGDRGWWLDFSSLTIPGDYYIEDVANNEKSATFAIDDLVYHNVLKTAGRAFYYNRCNDEKAAPYAETGWTDGNNFLNPLQDANCRFIYDPSNSGLEKDLSGGWFDAGDYNKYVTFAFSAVHTLLSAYEENPEAFNDNWNIPESGNGLPDLLDEIKWELDWLLKMNNHDGSTHIKMGSQNYTENADAPPSLCVDPRFYGPTCSAASIAVASMFAHAAHVYGQIAGYEIYADTLEARAIASWDYVLPMIDGNQLETACDDGSIISGDADWTVEEQLQNAVIAAMRLFQLTGDAVYHTFFQTNYSSTEPISSDYWIAYLMTLNDALLGYTVLPGANPVVSDDIIASATTSATNNWNGYYGFNSADLYRAYMPDWSYHWGSNLPKAKFANLNKLMVDYNIVPSSQEDYMTYYEESIHYFHGVNPQGVVYLSNMNALGAERSCNEIYHTWFADGTDWDNAETSLFGPAPGFVPGGPNKDFSVTALIPPSGQPEQKSYLDFNTNWPDNSWEITEPAIYYQAAYLRHLANFVDTDSPSNVGHIYADTTEIEIFPNPTNQYFVIRGNLVDYQIDLLNSSGQVISNLNTSNNEIIVDTSTLGSGLYLIRLQHMTTDQLSVQKIIRE